MVAFLPQKDINAYTPVGEVYLEESENTVPRIETTDTIYTTGDGLFQFAYVNNNSGVKVAVICGFDFERSLPGGNLTIPDTVDAYLKEYNSGGTNYGYVAVSMSNEPLYYKTYVDQESYEFVLDENGQKIPLLDENGAITYETDDNGQVLLDSNNNPIQAFKKELKTIKVFKEYSPFSVFISSPRIPASGPTSTSIGSPGFKGFCSNNASSLAFSTMKRKSFICLSGTTIGFHGPPLDI